jgi:hypothetical protein
VYAELSQRPAIEVAALGARRNKRAGVGRKA